MCFQQHLLEQSIKVVVILHTRLTQKFWQREKHFGKVFIQFGFSSVIFVDGFEDICRNSLSVLGVKVIFEVSEMHKIPMPNVHKSIHCGEN